MYKADLSKIEQRTLPDLLRTQSEQKGMALF